ncbi:MAG: AAA family ATPase, partial [Ferroplasma sp.]
KSTLALCLVNNIKAAYVNFDDERLINIKLDDLNALLEIIYSIYDSIDIFLFDEIENIKGWELFIRRLRNTKKIILTGSNSNLLSGELSMHLTGRHIDFVLYPFSFSEFLEYNSFEIKGLYSTLDKGLILKYFNEYMSSGRFPEGITIDKKMVKSIYNDIIQKDIINRYKVRK